MDHFFGPITLGVTMMPRLKRAIEDRVQNGLDIRETNKLIGRLEIEDIVLSYGIERTNSHNVVKSILLKVPHEVDGSDVIASAMDVNLECQRRFQRKEKDATVIPIEGKVSIELNPRTKSFLLKVAKKRDVTIASIINQILDAKVEDFYKRLEDALLDEMDL
jgi:dissimilatory sulfite reductase (desulfoviridin) alpha/beta subunit